MFWVKGQKSLLDKMIESEFAQCDGIPRTSEDYDKQMSRIIKLYQLKADETKLSRVSPDTWALVGANLLGIGVIVGYEHAHVITSKAFGLLQRTAV